MNNKLFLSLLLLLISMAGFTQTKVLLSGTVVSGPQNDPLPGANVVILSTEDSSMLASTSTKLDGSFQVEVPKGRHILQASFVGTESLVQVLEIKANKDLAVISLKEKTALLDLVDVVGYVPLAEQKGDTIQYNADAYTTNPDATAEELLQKMPGMQVKDGQMQAQGEEVKQVLVDGKPFFGSDPNAAMKNLPGQMIESVQVYDEMSEQAKLTGFDDGETTKTINIVTKKEFRNGLFGKVYGAAGTEDVYSGGAVANYFHDDQRLTVIAQSNNINLQNFSTDDLSGVSDGGSSRRRGPGPPSVSGSASDFLVGETGGISTTNAAGFNYSDQIGKRLELTASYFFNQAENRSFTALSRDYFSGQEYDETEEATSTNTNHRANLRLNYKLSERTTFTLLPSFSFQNYEGGSSGTGFTSIDNELVNETFTDYRSKLEAMNLTNRMMLMHRFEKRGRSLSFDFQQNYSATDATGYLNATSVQDTEIATQVIQRSTLDSKDLELEFRARYTEPIADKTMLQFSYAGSYSTGESAQRTKNYDDFSSLYTILDSSLSNSATTDYLTNRGGLGVMRRMDVGMLMLYVDYQYSTLISDIEWPVEQEFDQSYHNVLPGMRMNFHLSDSKELRLGVRTSSEAPEVSQLQEAVDNSNLLDLVKGNIALDQQLNYRLYSRYSTANKEKGTLFFVQLSTVIATNYIGQQSWSASSDTIIEGVNVSKGAQLTTYENFDSYHRTSLFSTYGFPLKKLGVNLNVNAGASYAFTPSIVNEVRNDVTSLTPEVGLVLSSNWSEKIDFTIGSTWNYGLNMNSAIGSNSEYMNQESSARLVWSFWKGFVFRQEITHQFYTGLTGTSNQNYFLANAELGKKLFKNKAGELTVVVFDIFNQNTEISRTISDLYIEDSETLALSRYAMLKFTYNFNIGLKG